MNTRLNDKTVTEAIGKDYEEMSEEEKIREDKKDLLQNFFRFKRKYYNGMMHHPMDKEIDAFIDHFTGFELTANRLEEYRKFVKRLIMRDQELVLDML